MESADQKLDDQADVQDENNVQNNAGPENPSELKEESRELAPCDPTEEHNNTCTTTTNTTISSIPVSEGPTERSISNIEAVPCEQQMPLPERSVKPSAREENLESDPKNTNTNASQPKENIARAKDDEKLAIYKALAIKLKKELVKSREELVKLKESSQAENDSLRGKVNSLEKTLDSERQANETTIATLEARIRTLQQQLEDTGSELQVLQNEFESYKVMASKIMQQNAPSRVDSNRTFEEDRYKQLKELSDDQRKRISHLESQLDLSSAKNTEITTKSQQLQEDLDKLRERLKTMDSVIARCETLSNENDNLKSALDQFRSKLRRPHSNDESIKSIEETNKPTKCDHSCNTEKDEDQNKPRAASTSSPTQIVEGVSPSTSIKDETNTNSGSSYDGSTSGYVHIKPTTFEIISQSSVLDDAQNQIDNLTRAYLDSESTNSLLTEQVKALKEEIRRMQRGSERLLLAENLEYLKNVVFKFLSLESSQVEQKQRLIPVLSTVLKLSPDETAKLNSLAIAERPSMASSFFKL